jgi:hypothetical protein
MHAKNEGEDDGGNGGCTHCPKCTKCWVDCRC